MAAIPQDYHQFKKVFEYNSSNALPPHRSYDMKIKLKDEKAKPHYSPIYQLSLKEQMELKEWIKDSLSKQFIRKSQSPYAAPIFFVPKKDGSLRPCIDYRLLNQNTVLDRHPLPLITQLMDQLAGAQIFTKLDLRGAYNLVRINAGDEYKAAFRCKDGHYEPLVMQFGLTNAPSVFQRFMNDIFQDLRDVNVIVYLDDILVYSKDLESHKKHVSEVFRRLQENDLSVKPSKCEFHKSSVTFLGFIISNNGLSMDKQKTEVINNFPVPKTVKQLRSFLGMTNFYRQFIKSYSHKAKPLTDLTRKSKGFDWTDLANDAFNILKQDLVQQVTLPFADYQKRFYLTTDASNHTIGAVLEQMDEDGRIRPVGFYSRKLLQAEENYSVYDRELLAIVAALKHWRHYLLTPVESTIINTDHQNLLYFKTPHLLKPRHARWAEFLSQFPFEINHIKGINNPVADAISRMNNLNDHESKEILVLPKKNWNLAAELNSISRNDEWPEEMIYFLQNDKWKDDLNEKDLKYLNIQLKYFKIKDSKLYRINGKEEQLYVPKVERTTIMKRYHLYLGHLASSSIITLINRYYWWPTLDKDLRDYVARCPQCQLNRSQKSSTNEQLVPAARPIPPVALPFERWGVDFIQNLPTTKAGNQHIITAIDYATRWVVALAVPNMNSTTVANFLYNQIFMNYGAPIEIFTDRGKMFLSDGIKEFEKRQAIHHIASTPHHPQTNGMVERMHAMIGHAITTLTEAQPARWDEFLPMTLFAIRVRKHATTQFSPFYLLYGVDPRLPIDPRPPPSTLQPLDEVEMLEFQSKFTARELDELGANRAAAYHRSLLQAEKIKKRLNIDENHPDYYFTEGDMVKLKHWDKVKFEFKWKGPYHIVKLGPVGTYWLMTPRGDFLDSTVNQRDLAPWLATTCDNQTHFYDGTTRTDTDPAPLLHVGSGIRREDSVKA